MTVLSSECYFFLFIPNYSFLLFLFHFPYCFVNALFFYHFSLTPLLLTFFKGNLLTFDQCPLVDQCLTGGVGHILILNLLIPALGFL